MSKKLLLLTALAAAVAPAALAQDGDRGRNDSVATRERAEYDPLGIRAGSLMLLPSLTLGAEAIDNLFSEETGEDSDVGLSARGALGVQSDWTRHELQATAGIQQTSYQDFDSEDRTDEFARATLRLDLLRDSYLRFGASIQNLGEGRGEPTAGAAAAGALKPIDYDLIDVFGEVSYTLNRLRLGGRIDLTDFAYDDRVPLAGGGIFDASIRDRRELEYTGRAEYAVSPSTAILFEGSFNDREYDSNRAGIPSRDSSGYELLVGANLDLTQLVRGEFGIGFIEQDYDNPAVGTVDGLGFDATIEWFVTPITTLTFNGSRSIEDVFDGTAGAFEQTSVSVDVDHELLRNVVLNGGVGYIDRDFRGRDRQEEVVRGQVGARYLVNRIAEIGGGYEFYTLESDGTARFRDYDVNRFLATLTLRR